MSQAEALQETQLSVKIVNVLQEMSEKDIGGSMKIKFTEKQRELMKKMDILFDVQGNLNEGQILDIETVVTEYLIENGIEEDESVNEIGKICESILEQLSEV